MRKTILVMLVFTVLLSMVFLPCYARTTPAVGRVEGVILHSIQSAWEIAETENSADTQTNALGATERTKKVVDALIAANAAQEAYIATFTLPSKWNGVRFRGIGITAGGSLTHQIYFGTLGGKEDCELTYAGQLAWTIGEQDSIYDQIAFTSGGTYEPQTGDTVTGNTSGETAVVVSISALSSGTWAGEDAAGTITYRSVSGTFSSGETIKITDYLGVTKSNVLTHTGSLVDLELADTLTATAKSWGSSWTATSPENDWNAEAEIDIKGADYMVVVTTTCSVDGKLLIKGY